MESGAAFFILVGAFLLIGIPVLAIAAFVRVGDLRRQVQAETPQLIARIYALERQLAQIEKALAGLSGAPTSRDGNASGFHTVSGRRSHRNSSSGQPTSAIADGSSSNSNCAGCAARVANAKGHTRSRCAGAFDASFSRRACRVKATAGISKRWSRDAG